jgi:hypothetical protein
MAYKQIQDLDTETTISLGGVNKKTGKKNPTSIEGYFLGKKEVESKKSKNGKAFLYTLQTEKGNVGVWGKTDLDRKMSAVSEGTMIRITQSGMKATQNGDMYKFTVEVDDENTIEVAAPKISASSDDDEPSLDEDEEIDSYESEESTQQAALLAAERQAKVKALLAKKK